MPSSTLALSPFIRPHAEETCRLLSLYGGGIVQKDGSLRAGVSYVRREGVSIARLIHVEDVESRKPYVFVLDEVSGTYSSGTHELWPLAPTASPGTILGLSAYLAQPLVDIVADFLQDYLPSRRPAYAECEHLRRHIRWCADDATLWETYWHMGDTEAQASHHRRRRVHQNIWHSRKRLCLMVVD